MFKDLEQKKKIHYRTASGDVNCSNCAHVSIVAKKLRCAFSPDVQFWAASYMRCDEHVYKKGKETCGV